MFELLPLLVYLLLVFRHPSIAFILDFFELEGELLFVLLSLCVSFLERADLFKPILSGIIKSLSDGL